VTPEERAALSRHIATWQQAHIELDEIRAAELRAVDTREAVRILFEDSDLVLRVPPRLDTGLVEQQAWFAKLRAKMSLE
jgi:hypothetical protein